MVGIYLHKVGIMTHCLREWQEQLVQYPFKTVRTYKWGNIKEPPRHDELNSHFLFLRPHNNRVQRLTKCCLVPYMGCCIKLFAMRAKLYYLSYLDLKEAVAV